MADPIVVPGVCRYVLEQEMAGIQLVNILDFDIDTNTFAEREDACFNLAGRILNGWYDTYRTHISNNLSLKAVSYIDLDSLAGSVGSRAATAERSFPQAGAHDDPPLPSFGAIRVKKNTTATRGARNGSMFLAGISEGYSTDALPNEINPTTLAALNADLTDFLDHVQVDMGDGHGYASNLVVVHKSEAGVYSHTQVTSLVAQAKISHQLRRAR